MNAPITKKLAVADLAVLALRLVESDRRVIAPVTEGEVTLFRQLWSDLEPDFNTWMTRNSAKEAVFPRSEVILSYRRDGQ